MQRCMQYACVHGPRERTVEVNVTHTERLWVVVAGVWGCTAAVLVGVVRLGS